MKYFLHLKLKFKYLPFDKTIKTLIVLSVFVAYFIYFNVIKSGINSLALKFVDLNIDNTVKIIIFVIFILSLVIAVSSIKNYFDGELFIFFKSVGFNNKDLFTSVIMKIIYYSVLSIFFILPFLSNYLFLFFIFISFFSVTYFLILIRIFPKIIKIIIFILTMVASGLLVYNFMMDYKLMNSIIEMINLFGNNHYFSGLYDILTVKSGLIIFPIFILTLFSKTLISKLINTIKKDKIKIKNNFIDKIIKLIFFKNKYLVNFYKDMTYFTKSPSFLVYLFFITLFLIFIFVIKSAGIYVFIAFFHFFIIITSPIAGDIYILLVQTDKLYFTLKIKPFDILRYKTFNIFLFYEIFTVFILVINIFIFNFGFVAFLLLLFVFTVNNIFNAINYNLILFERYPNNLVMLTMVMLTYMFCTIIPFVNILITGFLIIKNRKLIFHGSN